MKNSSSTYVNKPNLFILGAPKCGTTSLYNYLIQHQQVFFPKRKEIHYFNFDFANARGAKTIEEYHKHYKNIQKNKKIIGDASVMYLYSEVAVKEIYSYNKNSKFIVLIRNPIELAESFYYQLKFGQREDAKSFETAWKLQEKRKNGLEIPYFMQLNEPKFLLYGEVAKLGKQIERALRIIPKNQIKIILLEDLKHKPQIICSEIFHFLNLSDISKNINYYVHNESKTAKSEFISKLIIQQPFPIKQIKRALKYFLGKSKLGIRNNLLELNKKANEKKPISIAFRQELNNYFAKDIELLESILDRDLSHWK